MSSNCHVCKCYGGRERGFASRIPPLEPSQYRVKVVALQNAYMVALFDQRRQTLEGSLGWIGIGT